MDKATLTRQARLYQAERAAREGLAKITQMARAALQKSKQLEERQTLEKILKFFEENFDAILRDVEPLRKIDPDALLRINLRLLSIACASLGMGSAQPKDTARNAREAKQNKKREACGRRPRRNGSQH